MEEAHMAEKKGKKTVNIPTLLIIAAVGLVAYWIAIEMNFWLAALISLCCVMHTLVEGGLLANTKDFWQDYTGGTRPRIIGIAFAILIVGAGMLWLVAPADINITTFILAINAVLVFCVGLGFSVAVVVTWIGDRFRRKKK